jgi:hypothetical protein
VRYLAKGVLGRVVLRSANPGLGLPIKSPFLVHDARDHHSLWCLTNHYEMRLLLHFREAQCAEYSLRGRRLEGTVASAESVRAGVFTPLSTSLMRCTLGSSKTPMKLASENNLGIDNRHG